MFEITTTQLAYILMIGAVLFVLLAAVIERRAAVKKRIARRQEMAAIRARQNVESNMFTMLDSL